MTSINSKDNNLYDVLIKSGKRPNKSIIPPRRISSQTSISELPSSISNNRELTKRPSDYYIQKLSSSCLNLSNGKRPISGDSIISLNSTYSDEISLASYSETHDTRLSSLTSTSVSPEVSPNLSSSAIHNNLKRFTLEDTSTKSMENENLNHSLSTITSDKVLESDPRPYDVSINSMTSFNSTTSSINSAGPTRSLSTKSVHSTTTLTRTKTKYLSQEEIKCRQKLRKKQYDDSYNEDEILPNDIDLVFNVPVIKSQNELYVQKKFRSNLIDDNNYKPFPLPGKLRSNSTPNMRTLNLINLSTTQINETVEEEYEAKPGDNDESYDKNSNDSNSDSFENDDSEIINNISNYYNERSKSYSKLAQINRHENMMYKLPSYVRSQSSIDDLQFISPEKLQYVDQTRPINLPPKTEGDKTKHNKELQKMIKDFERHSLSDASSVSSIIINDNESKASIKSWNDLLNSENFNKRIVSEKNVVRKLNWDSNCIEPERFNYFMRLLTFHVNSESVSKIDSKYEELFKVYGNLNESIKKNRNIEFDMIISKAMTKPLISSYATNIPSFKSNYSKLLFLKSIDNSLHKHDEIFLIPILLILFPNIDTRDHYKMIDLIDSEIFNKNLILAANNDFSQWGQKLPRKMSKFLANIDLKEFDNLTFNKVFEILLQFNDKMPLSISAGPSASTSLPSSQISCCLEIVFKCLQLMLIYNVNTKTKLINHKKIIDSFVVVVVKYYHINWMDLGDLVDNNKSIKLNFNINNSVNLSSFVDKMFGVFKNI